MQGDDADFRTRVGARLRAEIVAEFDAIVAPLEDASGWRLNGKNRALCVRAFEESPDGFRACAQRAARMEFDARGRPITNWVGLFVKMILRDGEHRRRRAT